MSGLKKRAGMGAVAAVGAAAILAVGAAAHTKRPDSGRAVVDWNQVLLAIVSTPGAQPANIHPTRSFAMLHAAIYDAVNSIDRTHAPYLVAVRAPRGASETAAADAAAHAVLVALYPAEQATIDADYAAELAYVADGPAKEEGLTVGRRVAADTLAVRSDDGSDVAPPPFVAGNRPGDYRPTPPNFAAPVFTSWGRVTPFVLEDGSQFRPPAPPALTSDAYAAALAEVQSVGSATSTARTAEQTQIATFWSPPIQNFWNQIADTVALAHRSDLPTTARLFAALDLSLADSTIAFYDTKYAYGLWRPVTAIREADADGNSKTVADPTWLPLAGNTAPDPSYPGAHSTISAAAAAILASVYGDGQDFTLTSPALPGVTRSFTGFGAAAQEAGLSRIYAGQHTRLDHLAGVGLGRDVASFVLRNVLLPARRHGSQRAQ
ncbi:MAG: vanadium-dependent haloperoxidase [Gaiellaceae bacterium]